MSTVKYIKVHSYTPKQLVENLVHASTLPKPSSLQTETNRITSFSNTLPSKSSGTYRSNVKAESFMANPPSHSKTKLNTRETGPLLRSSSDALDLDVFLDNTPIETETDKRNLQQRDYKPRLSIHDLPPPNYETKEIYSDIVVPPPIHFSNDNLLDTTFDDVEFGYNSNRFSIADIDRYLIPSPPSFVKDDSFEFPEPPQFTEIINDKSTKTLEKVVYYDDTTEFYGTTDDIPPPLPRTPPPPLPEAPPPPLSFSFASNNIELPVPTSQHKIHEQQPPIRSNLPSELTLSNTNVHADQMGIASRSIYKGIYTTTYKPPQSPKNLSTKLSVSDKKKFFENAMEESQHPTPKPEKVFSYLSADEVERMRAEEERKIATLSRAEINSLSALDNSDDESIDSQPARPASTIGIVRTAKADRRLRDRMREEGLLTDEEDNSLSPAQERTLRAEKRAAWRQARLKSLEQDAIQAQMVIKSMTDMAASGEIVSGAVQKEEHNNKPEVETRQEKIISLELTKNDEELTVNGNNKCADDEEPESEEPTTPNAVEDRSLGEETNASNKKKRRKRSKKGKH